MLTASHSSIHDSGNPHSEPTVAERLKRCMAAIGQTIVSLVLLLVLFSIIFLGISADEQNSIKHYGTSDNPIADYYLQELDSLGLVVKDMLSKSEQIDQQGLHTSRAPWA